jgi:hypothetical protein
MKDVVLLEDSLIQHRMVWPDVDKFWKVMRSLHGYNPVVVCLK